MEKNGKECIGKVTWMSRVNGLVNIDKGRMVCELLARPSMEYAAEVWWAGGCTACRKLESGQMGEGRILLGESNTVAGVAVEGDLEWRKLE